MSYLQCINQILKTCSKLAKQIFQNFWFIFSSECQILMKLKWIKLDKLLPVTSQTNNEIQFTMENSKRRLSF